MAREKEIELFILMLELELERRSLIEIRGHKTHATPTNSKLVDKLNSGFDDLFPSIKGNKGGCL